LSTILRMSSLRSFVALCFVVSGFLCGAAPEARADSKEKRSRVVIPERAFEFGAVAQGTIVVHDFEIRNVGTADLLISRIAPTCGCTAAAVSSPTVPPGKSEKIRVQFDTSGFSGSKFKQIHVRTSDRDETDFVLTLRGTIFTDVKVEPAKVDFGEVAKSSSIASRQRDFTFTLAADSDRKIQSVTSSSKSVRVFQVSRGAKSSTYRVELLSSAALGDLRERIAIAFSGDGVPALNVPVVGRIVGDVRVVPATISFGVVGGSQPIERRVQWQNLASKPVRILDISSSDSALQADLIDIQPGKQGVVALKLDPRRFARDLRATVTMKTDNPEQPEVVVPVYGVKPPQ
jgi:hypothetical protein